MNKYVPTFEEFRGTPSEVEQLASDINNIFSEADIKGAEVDVHAPQTITVKIPDDLGEVYTLTVKNGEYRIYYKGEEELSTRGEEELMAFWQDQADDYLRRADEFKRDAMQDR